jgi:hypothetical protein
LRVYRLAYPTVQLGHPEARNFAWRAVELCRPEEMVGGCEVRKGEEIRRAKFPPVLTATGSMGGSAVTIWAEEGCPQLKMREWGRPAWHVRKRRSHLKWVGKGAVPVSQSGARIGGGAFDTQARN